MLLQPQYCDSREAERVLPVLPLYFSLTVDLVFPGQSRFGLEHTKPRRLQWTWLGHAELEYQGCLLHVSTLQMYILLCFNTAQV